MSREEIKHNGEFCYRKITVMSTSVISYCIAAIKRHLLTSLFFQTLEVNKNKLKKVTMKVLSPKDSPMAEKLLTVTKCCHPGLFYLNIK